ncbi:hypothetical protein BC835DRAFT_1084379 [Cytidiella melzeri]|nr:hypothetical protein BC835DRAFT_1084379 [Cytidiella melzeri]
MENIMAVAYVRLLSRLSAYCINYNGVSSFESGFESGVFLPLLIVSTTPIADLNDFLNMSLSSAAKMRIQSAPKAHKAIAFTRARSTAAGSSTVSMVEAKSRVREHVRNISQTTSREAVAAPSV